MSASVPAPPVQVPELPPRRPATRVALAGLSLSILLSSLDTSIANTSLPTLARAFGISFQAAQWIVLAYLLALTTLIVSAGRLGDLIGRRRLLLAGIAVFTAASALCGLAPAFGALLVARALQGVGAAAMIALAMGLVGAAVPRAQSGRAMGLLGTISAAGTALGPSLGGLLATAFGWRTLFLVNLPLGVLAFACVHRGLPAEPRRTGGQRIAFDHAGTVLLGLTLAAYALGLTIGHGRLDAPGLGLLALAALAGGLFLRRQATAAAPLIRLATLREPTIGASVAMSALVATVIMSTMVVGPFYLARGLGLATAQVGFVLSTSPVVAALSGVPAGRLVDRFGAVRMSVAGLVGMAVGCTALSLLPQALGVGGYVGAITVVALGYAQFQAANNTAVMRDVHADQRGTVSGVLNLSRSLGFVTGASVMGAVFSFASAARDITAATPAAIGTGMRTTYAVAAILMLVALAIAAAGRAVARRDGERRAAAFPAGQAAAPVER